VITDPNGIPGTGDETATPLSLNVSLPDTTFTPTGGNIAFTQGAPGSLPAIPAGQVSPGATTPVGGIYISAQVAGGLVKANFDCQVGTTIISPPGGTSGTTFTPGTASPFATVTVGGTGTTTTTVPGATTTTSTTVPGATTTTTTPGTFGGTAYTASCTNSTAPGATTIAFHGSGTAPAQTAPGAVVPLTGMHWSITVPASVIQTGLNLGLLTSGSSFPGGVSLGVGAASTVEQGGFFQTVLISIPVNTTAAGAALPATVSFDEPDTDWTAGTQTIAFTMIGADVSLKIGQLNVAFACDTTNPPAFATTSVLGVGPGSTTTIPATTTTVGPVSGTATYSASCSNNVTTDLAVLTFNGSGQVPGQVTADSPFTLQNMKWDVTIPAAVFQTGLNLGLISAGTPLQGLLDLSIKGTNTAQGVQDAANIALTVPVQTDGAGAALPSTVKFDVPNLGWTALTGQMDFSMSGAHVSVKVGPLSVVFNCKPTSGGPFVSAQASGVSHITTTTSVASGGPTVGAAGGRLVSTGPRDNLWIQLLAALLLLDLGYLTMSLLRSPRRRHA